MMPRLFDERVGYFTTSTMDYSRSEYKAERTRYIARWRLEKKDPTAAVSEPVKPIVYYIDAATPRKWVPWLKKGIEDWNEAFDAAGFKNAIIGKEAPDRRAGPRVEPRGCPQLRHPLAALHHRKRQSARTSATRAPARSSMRTFSSITTS